MSLTITIATEVPDENEQCTCSSIFDNYITCPDCDGFAEPDFNPAFEYWLSQEDEYNFEPKVSADSGLWTMD